jgi:two-component system alkaline phosphatase synthesis response regulator PhoP
VVEACVILLVDDNEDTLKPMQVLLANYGYDVMVARNGTDALRLVRSNKPSLVLLDVIMPGLSGFEVARTVRRDQQNDQTHILFWTVTPYPASNREARNLCADGVVQKPIRNLDSFLDLIARYDTPSQLH